MKLPIVSGLKIWVSNGNTFIATENNLARARRHQTKKSALQDIRAFEKTGILPQAKENLN